MVLARRSESIGPSNGLSLPKMDSPRRMKSSKEEAQVRIETTRLGLSEAVRNTARTLNRDSAQKTPPRRRNAARHYLRWKGGPSPELDHTAPGELEAAAPLIDSEATTRRASGQ